MRLPQRLTSPDSFTSQVVLAVRAGHVLVFRSGRARVGKSPTDAGAPPEVTQSVIACD
jgi:hypothetical protein